MKVKYDEQVSQLQKTIHNLEKEKKLMEKDANKENPYLATFLKYKNIGSLDRGLLVALVKISLFTRAEKSKLNLTLSMSAEGYWISLRITKIIHFR